MFESTAGARNVRADCSDRFEQAAKAFWRAAKTSFGLRFLQVSRRDQRCCGFARRSIGRPKVWQELEASEHSLPIA
jgi:hypothetical protein